MKELAANDSGVWREFRPDIVGSLAIVHPENRYTMVLYFTSEAEARVNETKDIPPELAADMAEMDGLEVGTPTFIDLRDPWLASPR